MIRYLVLSRHGYARHPCYLGLNSCSRRRRTEGDAGIIHPSSIFYVPSMDLKGRASAAQMNTKNTFVEEFVSAYSQVIVEKECHLLLVSKQIYLPDFSGNCPYFLQKPEKSCLVLLDS